MFPEIKASPLTINTEDWEPIEDISIGGGRDMKRQEMITSEFGRLVAYACALHRFIMLHLYVHCATALSLGSCALGRPRIHISCGRDHRDLLLYWRDTVQ